MEVAKTRNTRVTCKAQSLEGYFLKSVLEFGNNDLARKMGIHPSALSRDKNRIAKLASLMIVNLGLPKWAFELSDADSRPVVVIEGEHAEMLIQALERKGKVKRKTPVALTTEVSEMQLEMSI
ncbi:hypothetical protein [Xenorhabdus hominickii]|uniref:Transcriptional regulator n=1 Tax=Xenorhabdus hominickii TaxID=351679 RepID=A0A2G0Q242_XENHO|nr:hypothetical protein [Xenorhabdus hominickii]AOM40204.1 hypothetical protein A9255_06195 [Xenorhabdus hominickii]PHM53294.1 transcriptional regulator [Xenorhabdus hominickii]